MQQGWLSSIAWTVPSMSAHAPPMSGYVQANRQWNLLHYPCHRGVSALPSSLSHRNSPSRMAFAGTRNADSLVTQYHSCREHVFAWSATYFSRKRFIEIQLLLESYWLFGASSTALCRLWNYHVVFTCIFPSGHPFHPHFKSFWFIFPSGLQSFKILLIYFPGLREYTALTCTVTWATVRLHRDPRTAPAAWGSPGNILCDIIT